MYRTFLIFWIVVFLNLFAFLSIWIILDAIFEMKPTFTIWSIVISIIPLIYFMKVQIKKLNKQLNITNNDKNDSRT